MIKCDSQCIKKTEVKCRKCDWSRWNAKSCGCGEKHWDGIMCHNSRYSCHDETSLNNQPCDDDNFETLGDYCMNGQCISGEKINDDLLKLPLTGFE